MKIELEEQLFAKFKWLEISKLNINTSFEGFGLISNGWYPLVRQLCEDIELIYKAAGYSTVTMEVIDVKSKFAALCWRYRVLEKDEELEKKLHECINAVSILSSGICEYCSAENAEICNKAPVFHWWVALCPKCKAERIKSYNDKIKSNLI